jgi:hypothetical protein
MTWHLVLSNRVRATRGGRRWVVEALETRWLPSGPGYVLSGLAWPNPSHITFSIVGDGVPWDHGINNLNATMNGLFGPGVWETQIAKALQTWAAVANINIAEVPDANLPFNTPGAAQGDPRFGDIRIGGYNFNDPTTLAQTYLPPSSTNAPTSAGDSELNTAMPWTIGSGSGYDLYSVLLHEFGHALGLEESPQPGTVMYTDYGGVRTGLTADDIAGIQAIYGPRQADAYQASGGGTTAATAIDLTPGLNGSYQETVSGVSLATIGDTEYFSVVAPPVIGSQLQVTVIASGVSLLSPRVTLFNASQTPLTSAGNPSTWGDNVLATAGSIVPGQRYLIAVTGATQNVFAIGAYQLQVAFIGGTPLTAPNPQPPTPVPPAPIGTVNPTPPSTVSSIPTPPPAIPPDPYEPNNTPAQATWLGSLTATTLTGLTLDTPNDVDFFAFQAARPGPYALSAPGTNLAVLDARGDMLAQGSGTVTFWALRPGSRYTVEITPPGGVPVADYSLTIALQPPMRSRPAFGGFGARGLWMNRPFPHWRR